MRAELKHRSLVSTWLSHEFIGRILAEWRDTELKIAKVISLCTTRINVVLWDHGGLSWLAIDKELILHVWVDLPSVEACHLLCASLESSSLSTKLSGSRIVNHDYNVKSCNFFILDPIIT